MVSNVIRAGDGHTLLTNFIGKPPSPGELMPFLGISLILTNVSLILPISYSS